MSELLTDNGKKDGQTKEQPAPSKLTLRSYQVGFGDCYMLSFHYTDKQRHVLIDFGSTGRPKNADKDLMMNVARQVHAHCKGELEVLVATHRHQDHISGFATSHSAGKQDTGDIIRSCKPKVVIMPWTEDPKAETDAKHATEVKDEADAKRKAFTQTLHHMHAVAASVAREEKHLRFGLEGNVSRQLAFLGEDNLKNLSAVKNLLEMGAEGRPLFVRYQDKPLDLHNELPGVTVRVLGPPDLTQSDKITSMRSKDAEQFWMLQAAVGRATVQTNKATDDYLFHPAATGNSLPVALHLTPPHARWFIRKMNCVRGHQLLELVRTLDAVLNNTSVILLFEVGGKKLLFPGDAQLENWNYALSQKNIVKMLADVDVYKVGHHGSRNATPQKIWDQFNKKRSKHPNPSLLKTFMSTLEGKHGGRNPKDPHTEVPRESLVEALKQESEYFSTQMLGQGKLFEEFTIDLQEPATSELLLCDG